MTYRVGTDERRKNNKGYTTVELIIVIVLIMILAGGLVFGAVSWVNKIRFRRQNEYARTIFVAAQNQLTEYSESGQLEKMQKKLQNANGDYDAQTRLNVTELLDSNGDKYDLEKVWPESADGGGSNAKYRTEICSLKGTPDDYKKYQNGTADKKTKVLYDMIVSYLYDTSILSEGVVCLEFTPDDGQVFAALYSDVAKDFTYEESAESGKNIVSIRSRETKYRMERMVGYYGVDTLYKSTSTKLEKPTITALKLNNEDTLNLSFQIGKVKAAVTDLQYEVTVCEKNGKARLMFVVDGVSNLKRTIDCEVTRYQYDADGKAVTQHLGKYPILAWTEEENGNPLVRIVLDGADQAATSLLYQEAFEVLTETGELTEDRFSMSANVSKLAGTQSFRRFGLLGVEDIYCTVRGTGANYKPTAKKQSNTENAAFAQAAAGADGMTYTLKNARHLYNMRYLEDYTTDERDAMAKNEPVKGRAAKGAKTSEPVQIQAIRPDGGTQQYAKITYQLGADIDWAAFVKSGSLFKESSVQKTGDNTQFPSVRQLRSTSALRGTARQDYTISGLSVSAAYNKEENVYRAFKAEKMEVSTKSEDQLAAGLFVRNNGTIDQVSLDRITVEGGTNVGAFCGENAGVLKNLTVKNADAGRDGGKGSEIRGIERVGGITGAQLANAEGQKSLEALVNYARVTERANRCGAETAGKVRRDFGGIVGCLTTGDGVTNLVVKNCKNYGVVTATGLKSGQSETINIGGITGSVTKKNGHSVQIDSCVSSPQYTSAEIGRLLAGKDSLKAGLHGKYVGGIVGYNDGGSVTDCSTEKESAAKEGYVIGREEVGGIIGYNKDRKAVVDGSGRNGVNEAHVIGQKYVGGIIGGNPLGTVKNWKNEGFVAATEAYAGGITGYNGVLPKEREETSAKIRNCDSDVANTSAVRTLSAKTELFGADFVGGISGYNSAEMSADKEILLVSTVTGKNFVGGVVGFNEVDAIVKNYGVGGGYIHSNGTFVGGFCGLNASAFLLQDRNGNPYYVRSNPNLIEGAFCVGGVIGGNIVPAEKGQSEIVCGFAADNFLGKLEASGAYAGGYVGCNWMVQSTGNLRELIMEAAQLAARNCENIQSLEEMAKVDEILVRIDGLESADDCAFIIDGSKSGQANSQARLGGITAQIYAGGVVGCNEPGTELIIRNVENKTPVTARASVVNDAEQGNRRTYNEAKFRYSYTGGIIGKVTEKVTLDNCRNRDSGSVITQGTYTGGLCEINEGRVIRCTASSLGSSKNDYVGGIVGLNKAVGTIRGCTLESGRTITGRNIVGGIAADNFGNVSEASVKGSLRAYGARGVVGGVAAYNEGTVTVAADTNVRITATGDRVGGIIGENAKTGKVSGTQNGAAVVDGSVSGNCYVGGIVGENKADEPMRAYTNRASVLAERGYAGGIAGKTAGNISDCHNEGAVTARQSGDAGGIVAENTGKISNCTDTGLVNSSNGMCGGIAARNGAAGATITGCSVYGAGGSDKEALVFLGKDRVGGICAVNAGTIEQSYVYNVTLNDLSTSSGNLLGGITAENGAGASIAGCTVGYDKKNKQSPVKIVSLTTGASAGGATGRNAGAVSGTKVRAQLAFTQTDMAYYGNLGGVAGENHGVLEHCAFSGTVAGTANSPQNPPQYDPTKDGESSGAIIYGYGGIAGVNGSSDKLIAAQITGCSVTDAQIIGIGDATNIANIGGVAGVNAKGATIEHVTVGAEAAKAGRKLSFGKNASAYLNANAEYNVYVGTQNSSSAFGHAGGVAGLNSGRIRKINNETEGQTQSCVAVENYRGHVGGIVGYNRRTGLVDDVQTGAASIVFAPQNASDNGCGGIIGYQAGEGGLSGCVNRARVVKVVASSNGVGGMIGRMEVATARNYLIQNCVNYGNIYGNYRVGGMIGVAKYYGGTLSKCKNYGQIQSASQGTGGMIGHLYSMHSDYGAVYVTGCENHGFIDGGSGSYAAGIIGGATVKTSEVHIADCVNTGLIRGTNAAGITALGAGNSGAQASTVIRCRNYGYAYGSRAMGGILAANTEAKITVQGCFGVSQLTCPIAPAAAMNQGSDQNYYIVAPSADGVQPAYISDIECSAKVQNKSYIYKIAGQATDQDLEDKERAYYSWTTSPNDRTYVVTFSRPVKLSELTLYWWNDGGNREQDYKVEYSPDLNSQFESCYTVTNSTEDGCAKQQQTRTLDVAARRIKITVTKTWNPNTKNDANACLLRVHFKEGETPFTGQLQNTSNKYAGINGVQSWTVSNAHVVFIPASGSSGSSALGGGTAVHVEPAGAAYRLVNGATTDPVGKSGFSMNPYEQFNKNVQTAQNVQTDHSLLPAGTGADNIRYQVFAADDPYLIPTVSTATALQPPANVRLDGIAGGVKLSWNAVNGAHYYEYVTEFYDEAGNLLGTRSDKVYRTGVELPVAMINGTAVSTVKAKVRAGADTQTGVIWSDYASAADYKISDALPTPQYHLELTLNSRNELQYKVFLDNQEEYKQFLQGRGFDPAMISKIRIEISAGGTALSFTADKTQSAAVYAGATGNVMFAASAKDIGTGQGFASSAQTLRESYAYTHAMYTNDEKPFAYVRLSKGDDQEVGFYGDTDATLQYMAKLRFKESQTYYMRTELLAADKSLSDKGIPVSVSSSEVRISDTSTEYIKTMLASLPTDLMNQDKYGEISLRSYPTIMSNNVVYNGHDVALPETLLEASQKEGVTAEQLKAMRVTDDGSVVTNGTGGRLLIENETLAPGYVIRRLTDGSYSLYYNALLAYNAVTDGDQTVAGATTTQMHTQVYTYNWSGDQSAWIPKHPAPVIHVNYDETTKTEQDYNADEMVITWDLKSDNNGNNYKDGAVYDYTVTGYTADDKESVQIIAGQYTTDYAAGGTSTTRGNNTLVLDTTTWKYARVEISISRRGTVDQKGKTQVLPNGALRDDIRLKLSLSQIEAPTIALHADESGEVQKNALDYDVTWSNIPQEERDEGELKGFEITAVRNGLADTAAMTECDSDDERSAAWNALTARYNEKAGKAASDTTEGGTKAGTKVWTWETTENGMAVKKTMEVELTKSEDGSKWIITRNLTSVWTMDASADQINAENVSTVVDLSDYERGEALQISVRALATPDTADYTNTYRNGPKGVSAEMTLPSRLDVPDVTKLAFADSLAYKADESIAIDQIENGLGVVYTPEAGTVDTATKGNYQLAVAVYEQKPDGAESDVSQAAENWSEGARIVLSEKNDPVVMGGDLAAASHTLESLNRIYGGMWLKIAMRSVSDSNVSSWWSDEDAQSDGTVNYQWIRIPRVQEETPNVTQKTNDLTYHFKDESYVIGDGTLSISVKQTAFEWQSGALAEHYKIAIVRNPVVYNGQETEYQSAVTRLTDWIYMQKRAGGYDLFYQSSDPAFDADAWRKAWNESGKTIPAFLAPSQSEADDGVYMDGIYQDAVYIGSVTADTPCQLPWTGAAQYTDAGEIHPIQTVSRIVMDQDGSGVKITLQLPDVEQVANDDSITFTETEQIAVQAYTDNGLRERYEDSDTSLRYRVNGTFEPTEIPYNQTPDAPNVEAKLSRVDPAEGARTESYLRIQVGEMQQAWLTCRVTVTYGNGQKKIRYVSSYGNGTSAIANNVLLPADLWLGDQVSGVTELRVDASAVDVTGKGFSKWMTWTWNQNDLKAILSVTEKKLADEPKIQSDDPEGAGGQSQAPDGGESLTPTDGEPQQSGSNEQTEQNPPEADSAGTEETKKGETE